MLYITVWSGEETDWITCTPNDPRECDSSQFDEGICTGFKVANHNTEQFISEYMVLLRRFGIEFNRV